MAGRPDRDFDKTYLSIDAAEERGIIHRDYIAHCLRWSHVAKFLNQGKRYENAVVLDVGCGKEMPLAKTLYVNKMSPALYVGVDVNAMDIPAMLKGKKIRVRLFQETDASLLRPEHVSLMQTTAVSEHDAAALPNVCTSFEVLEHMTPGHCRKLLAHLLTITSANCDYFFSTPCWNGSAAANHINEMRYDALGALFEDLGYKIVARYGTFASIKDYEPYMNRFPGLAPVFDRLREYYDTNLIATMFAPLFPAQARNVLWHLVRRDGDLPRQFLPLINQPTPWSQHPDWVELSGLTHVHSAVCGNPITGAFTCSLEGLWPK